MNSQKFWLRMVYLGYISVSRSGVITTVTGKKTTGTKTTKGYRHWCAWDRWNQTRQTTGVHRLVWITFKSLIPEGFEINHKDNDPSNNRLDNLELVTHQGNSDHTVTQGMQARGERHGRSKLTDEQVMEIRSIWNKARRSGKVNKNEFARQHTPEGATFWLVLYVINGSRYRHLPMMTEDDLAIETEVPATCTVSHKRLGGQHAGRAFYKDRQVVRLRKEWRKSGLSMFEFWRTQPSKTRSSLHSFKAMLAGRTYRNADLV